MRGFVFWMNMLEIEFIKEKKNILPIQITGCDEVGRGPLAGPVVACATTLIVEEGGFQELSRSIRKLKKMGVTDSKKMTSGMRQELLQTLRLKHLSSNQIVSIEISKKILVKFIIKEVSADTIDKINILQASLLAMKSAAIELNNESYINLVLIDGNKVFKDAPMNMELVSVIKGDAKVVLISLASIIAKEYRDLLMTNLAEDFPEYGWDSNSGYPTKFHLNSIEVFGLTTWHRKTFRGVREVYEKRGVERS